jgi:phosphoenolpyruvate carboxykinase (ATP)
MEEHPVFGLNVPTSCDGVPDNLWDVRGTWDDQGAYDLAAQNLAQRFEANFVQFEAAASDDMKAGAPRVEVTSGQ